MAELLGALAIDRTGLRERSAAITGSNGKGSTAAFCARIGAAHGLRTGLFTSPHLFRVNERFQIDGVTIEDETLKSLTCRIRTAIDTISRRNGEQFGAFEAMFALACLYFQERDCQFLVFEAGIGGRFDPVRLLDSPLTCVTSVDFEHVELLGNSLQLIVSDKSDACASGGTIIYGENCRDLRPHIVEYNRSRNVQSLFVGDEIHIEARTMKTSDQGFSLRFGDYNFQDLTPALPGRFQYNNAAIATALFLRWLERMRPSAMANGIEAAVRSGLRDTRWPGRLEAITQDPLTVIDVGHTPDAIRQSLTGLHQTYGADGWILVIGISFDKRAEEIAQILAPAFGTIICTAAHHKGGDAAALAAIARKANPKADVQIAPTIEQAFNVSRSIVVSEPRKIYVAGSLFAAIEYAAIVRGVDAKDLDFF
jgi:dihydrofolate synthase/folylpolyglutamate synthase